MSRYRDPRAKRPHPVPLWQRLLLAALPLALGVAVVWRGMLDPLRDRPGDVFVVWPLLALSIAGVLGAFSSPTKWGGRAYRAAAFLSSSAVAAFIAFLIIGGLFAPWLVADPLAGRAPRTEFGATALAVVLVAALAGVFVTTSLEKRRARRP